jgi:hypothetical protein
MGSWYDRAGNEYFIGMRGTNGGRQTNLEVRQVNLNSIGAGWVEGEIVAFNCWLPQMGQFEGRLFRSSGDSTLSTMVGKYTIAGPRSFDVTLYRSPAP